MSSELVAVHQEPDLTDPVLVIALDGWVDAGFGMRNATEIMVQPDDAVLVASFDADLLVDHRARRPTMTVRDGRVEDISWPAISLQVVSDLDQREFLMLHGPEPDFRWKAFCTAVDDLVQRLGVTRAVSLGAYPRGGAPHPTGAAVGHRHLPKPDRAVRLPPGNPGGSRGDQCNFVQAI